MVQYKVIYYHEPTGKYLADNEAIGIVPWVPRQGEEVVLAHITFVVRKISTDLAASTISVFVSQKS